MHTRVLKIFQMNDKPRIAKCKDSESLLITREPSIRKGVSDERPCDYGSSKKQTRRGSCHGAQIE